MIVFVPAFDTIATFYAKVKHKIVLSEIEWLNNDIFLNSTKLSFHLVTFLGKNENEKNKYNKINKKMQKKNKIENKVGAI